MADHVTLSPEGRLQADDASTAERLRGSAGRYRFVPSSPDLVVLVREPAQGGTARPPRVALAGDLACTPLAELVEFLHQGRRSGTLRVTTPGGERTLLFQDGLIRGASSDEPADSLPEICLRLGLATREALDPVLAAQPPHHRVGRALVEAGALDSHALFKAVQHQVGEIVYGMLVAREGAFLLIDEPVEDKGIQGVQLSTQALLMDAIRRIDEMAQFRTRLPSGKLYLVRRKPAGAALEAEERELHGLCNGERTLIDLARALHLSEFDTTKIAYHLLQGGYISTSPSPQPLPEAVARHNPADVARVFQLIFGEILAAVGRHSSAQPMVDAANAALMKESEARSPFLRGVQLTAQGTFETEGLLTQLEPGEGAIQARAVYSGLAEVMFFLLFQAGEVLTPQEDEALARRVKELLANVEPA